MPYKRLNQMHNPLWTSLEGDVVTGGESSVPWQADGVSLNIDDVCPGDLFLAGPDDDIELAYQKGAAVVAVPRGVRVRNDRPVLKVGSAFTALQGLSAAARFRTHACVVSAQGRQARGDLAALLAVSAQVHVGGKHVSLGLANLPENADFGVFGLSPAVKPDIAIITNPEAAHRDTLFENMGPRGTVIVYADAEGFLDVIARAKAAGIDNILTYGRHPCADAVIDQCVIAQDGIRLSGAVMGEEYTVNIPRSYMDNTMILAAFLVLKLNNFSVDSIVPAVMDAGPKHNQAGQGVRLMDRAAGSSHTAAQAVFRVRNMIDLGRGRQTAVLDNLVTRGAPLPASSASSRIRIPNRLTGFDLVHTSRNIHTVHNPHRSIKSRYGSYGIESVSPDVLAPGDFLVFRSLYGRALTVFSEALRLVPGVDSHAKTEAI